MAAKTSPQIIVAVIGAVATVSAAYFGHLKGVDDSKKLVTLQVNVFDANSTRGIPDAFVEVEVEGSRNNRKTDSEGRVTFELSKHFAEHLARVKAEARNFTARQYETRLAGGYRQFDIRLSPAQQTSTVEPPAGTPAQAAVRTVRRTFTSGPRLSGSGSAFSDWYTICSEGIPSAARIVNVSFALSGDRRCNAWASCREVELSASRVCYQFQLQGHNEWPAPGQAQSEGVLTVDYTEAA